MHACGSLSKKQRGSAVVETLLLLPGIIAFLLLFFQLILLFHAELMTSYSAFCAVRAAIVLSPNQLRGVAARNEPLDLTEADRPELQRVRRAAAIALIPVSPLYSAHLGVATQTAPNIQNTEQLAGLAALFPPTSGNVKFLASMAERAPYALSPNNTRVALVVKARNGGNEKALLVTVQVRYRYLLIMPLVGRLIGKSFPGAGFFGGYYYYELDRSYTLPVQAEDIFPEPQSPLYSATEKNQ